MFIWNCASWKSSPPILLVLLKFMTTSKTATPKRPRSPENPTSSKLPVRHFRSTKGTSNQSWKSTQVATTSDLHYKLTNINQPHKDSIVEPANGIEPREAPLYFTETLFCTKWNKMKPILSSIPDIYCTMYRNRYHRKNSIISCNF